MNNLMESELTTPKVNKKDYTQSGLTRPLTGNISGKNEKE